jgi:hypothetical protein
MCVSGRVENKTQRQAMGKSHLDALSGASPVPVVEHTITTTFSPSNLCVRRQCGEITEYAWVRCDVAGNPTCITHIMRECAVMWPW